MAHRYGFLPSQIMKQATTFDLQVLDIAFSYEAYLEKKSKGELPEIAPEVMEQVLKEVRKND